VRNQVSRPYKTWVNKGKAKCDVAIRWSWVIKFTLWPLWTERVNLSE
jgi:hypothetical protein